LLASAKPTYPKDKKIRRILPGQYMMIGIYLNVHVEIEKRVPSRLPYGTTNM